MTFSGEERSGIPTNWGTPGAPMVIVAPQLDQSATVRLVKRLEADDVQASLRRAALAWVQTEPPPSPPPEENAPASDDASSGEAAEHYWSAVEKEPPLWGSPAAASATEVGDAFFQPWLPLSGLTPPHRLFHRLINGSAFLPAILLLVGFAAAQFASGPVNIFAAIVSDAEAAPLLSNIDTAAARLYVQLGILAMAVLIVCVAFVWSIWAASSKQARIAALGTKVFSQVLTFVFGALTGFLAT